MRHSKLITAYAGLSLFACSQGDLTPRQQMVEEQAVAARLDTWMRSMNNRERDSVAAVYHQVAELKVVWPDGRVTNGWGEEQAAQSDFFDCIERVNIVATGREVEILNPDVAIATLWYSMDMLRVDGERETPVSGYATFVWMKDASDNVWKIHTQHVSATPPQQRS